MKQQRVERVWHLGLSTALAASLAMLGACSNETGDTGDRSEGDAVAEKVFSSKSEGPTSRPEERQETSVVEQTAPPEAPAPAEAAVSEEQQQASAVEKAGTVEAAAPAEDAAPSPHEQEPSASAPAAQPAAAAQSMGATLRERLKAKGWKEVKQADGSVLLMPPGSN